MNILHILCCMYLLREERTEYIISNCVELFSYRQLSSAPSVNYKNSHARQQNSPALQCLHPVSESSTAAHYFCMPSEGAGESVSLLTVTYPRDLLAPSLSNSRRINLTSHHSSPWPSPCLSITETELHERQGGAHFYKRCTIHFENALSSLQCAAALQTAYQQNIHL